MGLFDFVGQVLDMGQREDAEDAAHQRAQADRQWSMERAAQSDALQREFAQHGIRWRVEDAKAAGLHPVFALSGSGAAYSPSSVSVGGGNYSSGGGNDFSRMGQSLDRALAATETVEQRQQREMAIAVAQSQVNRNNAEAGYFDSMAAKNYGLNPPMPSAVPESQQYDGGLPGQVLVKPAEVTSNVPGDASVAAGHDVAWRRIWLTPHLYAYLPNSNEGWAESWGELSWYDKAAILQHNEARQPGFSKRFVQEFLLGQGPMPKAVPWVENDKWVRDAEGELRHRPGDYANWNRSGRERGINWRARPLR